MKSYNNFKKLGRAKELLDKDEKDRTSSENNQLKALLADADIKKYIT